MHLAIASSILRAPARSNVDILNGLMMNVDVDVDVDVDVIIIVELADVDFLASSNRRSLDHHPLMISL